MSEDPMVAALLRERAGYVQRGLKDRVAAVDAELERHGHKPPAETPAAQARTEAPRGRRARRTETA